MALASGNKVSITVEQSLLGEEVLNIFYYVWNLVEEGVALYDLLLEFKDVVWDIVRLSQNADVVTNNFVARNLSNGVDIDTLNSGDLGLDATGGDVCPSYVAAGYALNVGTLETRPGSKRIAGPGEQRVNDNDYVPGGTVATDIETAFAATLPVTGVVVGEGDLIPYIIGRDVLGALDLLRTQPVLSCQVSATIRSQVSRRVG